MIEELNINWDVRPLERPFGRGINISMSVDNIEEMFSNLKKKSINFS